MRHPAQTLRSTTLYNLLVPRAARSMRRLRKNLHPFTVEPQSQISRLESMDLTQKSAALHQILGSLDLLLVAYSGGTDSAYLAYAAHRALRSEEHTSELQSLR